MPLIDLNKFCDPEVGRFSINKPRTIGLCTYATDGRIGLRCLKELCLDPGAPNEGRFPDIDGILKPIDLVTDWRRPTPDIDCTFCLNTYFLRTYPCKKCNGTKLHKCDCGTTHDCGACDGTGKDRGEQCDHCIETFKSRRLARRYVRLIASLPDAVMGAPNFNASGTVFFRFAGGSGVLMPLAPHA